MIRAVIGDGIFGLLPKVDEVNVTCWQLVINKESILGKPCELKDVDTDELVATVLLPEEIDQVSQQLALPRI